MERRWWLATIALILFCAAIQLSILPGYGVSWDEPVQSKYGELVVDYFKSGFRDQQCNNFLNLKYYGPAFEALAAVLYAPIPQLRFEIRHLLVLLTAIGGLFALASLARKSRIPPLPFFAVTALVCSPQFFGHSFSNSKDLPFAVLFVSSILAIVHFVEKPDVGRALLLGLALGGAISLRIAGVILFGFLFVAVVLTWSRQRDGIRRFLPAGLLAGAVAVIVVFATWPYLQQSPIHNTIEAFRAATRFPVKLPVLFAGHRFWSVDPPRIYLPAMIAVTTPIPLLILAVGGFVFSAIDAVRRRDAWSSLVVLWVSFPLIYFLAVRPTAYDGMRHYLFVLPAIALLAARAAAEACERWPHRATVAVAVLLLASSLPRMVRLHPYQYTYYNAFVGGTRGASDTYETDYWLFSYAALARWVADHPCATGRPPRILLAGDRNAVSPAAAYLPEGSRLGFIREPTTLSKLPDYYDYYIATTRYALDVNFPQTPIVTYEGREGAIFAIVRSNCPAARK